MFGCTASSIYNNYKGVTMRCKKHPNEKLELASTQSTQKVAWSDEPIRITHDIEYCPKCFEEHETGKPMFHELIPVRQPIADNEDLKSRIDLYIENSIK